MNLPNSVSFRYYKKLNMFITTIIFYDKYRGLAF